MVRALLDEKPPDLEEEETESKVLNSEFFSGPRLARRKEVLRGMRGNLHGGHK